MNNTALLQKKAPVERPTGAFVRTLIGRLLKTPSDPLFERHQLINPPVAITVAPTHVSAARRNDSSGECGAQMPSIRAARSALEKYLFTYDFMSGSSLRLHTLAVNERARYRRGRSQR
jgi:hypothetical protein